MQYFDNPPRTQWSAICRRPLPAADPSLQKRVDTMLKEVRENGDTALLRLIEALDGVKLDKLAVSPAEFREAIAAIPPDLSAAIALAAENIRKFHEVQSVHEPVVETLPGVRCWRKSLPIEKVGLYIPGGTAPLFSTVLMLGIPAMLAGCPEIYLCTPCDRQGKVSAAVLYAAQLLGVKQVFKIGGAQAIAAMAYGTGSVPAVHKIFGPGNGYVTRAKERVLQSGVAIDLPAGPSEVLVIADQTADPEWIAADLLAQAEHGSDSQVVLVTTAKALIAQVGSALERQLEALPRKSFASKALAQSFAIWFENIEDCLSFSNAYAPEHLILSVENPRDFTDMVRNAGSVFLGHYSPETAGDYASGTNHTLPTGGYARAYSGVSVDSFVKKISFQELTAKGLADLAPTLERLCEAEGLVGHRNAVRMRIGNTGCSGQLHKQNPIPEPVNDINLLVRENIRTLAPYASARMESTLAEGVFLDANENPYGEYNRYPDPLQQVLRRRIAMLKGVTESQVFTGNGSDELIDLVFRIFCEPGRDEALTFYPTYGMYAVAARINAVTLHEIPLTERFELNLEALKPRLENPKLKLILLCSPNNPTGNRIPAGQVQWLLQHFKGIVFLDEAYIDFCPESSMLSELLRYPRLIISQTLSKAWGMAGLRLGLGFASKAIIQWLDKVKPPYNISSPNQAAALNCLQQPERMWRQVAEIRQEREQLAVALSRLTAVRKVYPSDANFLLVKVSDAPGMYAELIKRKIVIRNRHTLLTGCLRITIGSPAENKQLLTALTEICHA